MNWLFSIRTKIFALVFFACFTLIAFIYWQIGTRSDAVANQSLERSLAQSSTILNTRLESRFRFIRELALGIARDGRVLPLVSDEQSLTLQDLSGEYENIYDFDVLFFLNAQGTIIARADNPDAVGVNVAGRTTLFDEPLSGIGSQGFIVSQGKLMQTVVEPVFDNIATDLVKGAVVLAYELSAETAQEIFSLTESDIGFYIFTRDENFIVNGVAQSYITSPDLSEHVSRYFSENNDEWRYILDADSDDLWKIFNINNEQYHSVLKRINGKDGNRLGFILSTRSETALKKPFKEIQLELLVAGGVCLLFASVLAILLAIGIGRPIVRLVDVINQIQSGFYPKVQDSKVARDEVGVVKQALIKMGLSLREKAELESYLAELSEEIESATDIEVSQAIEKFTGSRQPVDATLLRSETSLSGEETLVVDTMNADQKAFSENGLLDERYEIQATLGSGAMGSVFLAKDRDLDEKIAIKVIQKNYLNNLNVKEEIRLARKITHRNIVRTFDFGSWSDSFYITMEYVPGYDLGSLIAKKGGLDTSIGLAISKQICSAMISAHQIGIIHRDLKPSNMMINRQGILKIMDFGLAMQVEKKNIEAHDTDTDSSEDKLIMGTPRYMAPEQFKNEHLDERTDIYAIGVIMFTMFEGEPPFSNPDYTQLAKMHLADPVPQLTRKNEDLSSKLNRIIHKAMAKEAKDRYPRVRDLLDELNAL